MWEIDEWKMGYRGNIKRAFAIIRQVMMMAWPGVKSHVAHLVPEIRKIAEGSMRVIKWSSIVVAN